MSPKIHHFGMVLAKTIEDYLRDSIWELKSEIVTDPLQLSRLCMVGPIGSSETPLIELIEPQGNESPTYRSAKETPGWHHVCFWLPKKDAAEEYIRKGRMLPVTPWKPAVLFDGRLVRFVYSRNRELIELVVDEYER
jgi:hypothetical protein